MVGDRHALLEQPPGDLHVAALGEYPAIDGDTAFE
jgi:hypothetical protein